MANDGRGGFAAGLVVGALLGGAVAWIAMDEETRDLLIGKAREASNVAMDATSDLRGKVDDAAQQWQQSASQLYERGRSVVDQARDTMGSAVEEGRAQADQLRKTLGLDHDA